MPARIVSLPSGRPLSCEILSAESNTLKLRCPVAFPLRSPVLVENPASLWMGEIWVCEPEPSGFYLEIEVSQVLRDPAAIERMASRFRQTPNSEETTPHLA
jgi:hypothetical protein